MLRPIQPYVEYVINQDYIAEFLCVNKDKPKLQCHGKCHLAKEIDKQRNTEDPNSLGISLENYPIGFVKIYGIKAPQSFFTNGSQPSFSNIQLYRFDYFDKAYQPPDLA